MIQNEIALCMNYQLIREFMEPDSARHNSLNEFDYDNLGDGFSLIQPHNSTPVIFMI